MRPLTPPTQTLGPTSLGSTLPRSQRTSTVGSLILSLSPSLLASQVPLLLDAIRIWRRFCVENGIFESAGGAVTCGSLHMGEIRVGNKRANQRHHICNETFLIWGKDFWAEFELYLIDILVGLVVSVALVGMLAPYARIGKPSISSGFLGRIHKAYAALPSRLLIRLRTYFYKGIMYGADGFGCGIIGQGIANLILTAKCQEFQVHRVIFKSTPIPPNRIEHKDIRRRHTCATTCEEHKIVLEDIHVPSHDLAILVIIIKLKIYSENPNLMTKKVSVWGALKHCTGMAFFCIGW
ncbi:hypothetical protein JHK82_028162 [Glycine max]|nr:hypothetical protein JHK85_028827 [Glycine max]KAG5127327.1 hypothetical protein JHK82_028162 [Glycine max]KAG5151941.1 hypothetical protein JHK84_028413 [Glycine max]